MDLSSGDESAFEPEEELQEIEDEPEEEQREASTSTTARSKRTKQQHAPLLAHLSLLQSRDLPKHLVVSSRMLHRADADAVESLDDPVRRRFILFTDKWTSWPEAADTEPTEELQEEMLALAEREAARLGVDVLDEAAEQMIEQIAAEEAASMDEMLSALIQACDERAATSEPLPWDAVVAELADTLDEHTIAQVCSELERLFGPGRGELFDRPDGQTVFDVESAHKRPQLPNWNAKGQHGWVDHPLPTPTIPTRRKRKMPPPRSPTPASEEEEEEGDEEEEAEEEPVEEQPPLVKKRKPTPGKAKRAPAKRRAASDKAPSKKSHHTATGGVGGRPKLTPAKKEAAKQRKAEAAKTRRNRRKKAVTGVPSIALAPSRISATVEPEERRRPRRAAATKPISVASSDVEPEIEAPPIKSCSKCGTTESKAWFVPADAGIDTRDRLCEACILQSHRNQSPVLTVTSKLPPHRRSSSGSDIAAMLGVSQRR